MVSVCQPLGWVIIDSVSLADNEADINTSICNSATRSNSLVLSYGLVQCTSAKPFCLFIMVYVSVCQFNWNGQVVILKTFFLT